MNLFQNIIYTFLFCSVGKITEVNSAITHLTSKKLVSLTILHLEDAIKKQLSKFVCFINRSLGRK